ncbi:MAG: glycosyltransferase [Candidatus Eisenbacteria bacterium]
MGERMRICQVCSGDLWAGKESVCAALSRGLARSPRAEVSAVLFGEGRLARELRDAGIRVDVVDERQGGVRGMIRRMRSLLAETRPQVIHAHAYKEHILGVLAARGSGARVVRTLHGLPEPRSPGTWIRVRLLRALQSLAIHRGTDVLVVVSREMEARLGPKAGRARVVRIVNGIETERLPVDPDPEGFRRELGLEKETVLFGAVGRLAPIKGLGVLLEAAAMLAREYPEHRYLIVGDGPSRADLERRAANLGVAGSVLFLGHREDAVRVVGCLDALVMPSLHEGMPVTLLEARAFGVPVVATRVGGVAEAVSSEQGLLVRPGDPDSLAEGLRKIRALGRRRGERSPSDRLGEFTAARMVGEHLRVYEEEAGAAAGGTGTRRDEP